MGKFVTYGVTETLDNDQKFIIDSDRTGPGSITAKDAASSFLSKWAGFDTFEEAVQNTISNNQEFIDRDTAIRNETDELKKKIVTTFPAKDASGAVATFESEFEDAPLKSCIVRVEPVQDLHGYDHPWPAGGGKNLLFNQAKTTTRNGITFTVNYDGTVTANGTATGHAQFECKFLDLIPAGNYYFTGCPSGGGLTTFNVYPWDDKTGARLKNWDGITDAKSDFGAYTLQQIQIPEGSSGKLVLRVISGTTVNNIIFKPMVVRSTETDSSYTPYKNICPITGWTGCEVQRTGKNLLTNTVTSRTVNGLTFTVNSNKSITVTGTATANTEVLVGTYLPLKEDVDYITTANLSNWVSGYYLGLQVKNKTTGANRWFGIRTQQSSFRLNNERVIKAYICVEPGIAINETFYPMIRLVTETDSTYEPYAGDTYPITFPTEAGTVYGAYVDVTGGELVVDRAMVDLGTLTWSYTSSYLIFISTTVPGMKTASNKDGKCSVYKKIAGWVTESEWTNGDKIFTLSGNDARLRIKDTAYTDASAFKSAMNGVQLVYELAEPIHYPLTPTEIKTLLGTNNVWANTGDTEVEYLMSDVSWYVEKKLKAFQSILAGVEDSAVASKNYSTNTYLIFNDDIYRVTKAITAGETIEEGVNVTKTTVAEQLMALAQA